MLRLLIADQSEEFCNSLAELLSQEYEILTCGRGTDALRGICAFSPDLLVLDLSLPGLEGIDILQQAAKQGPLPRVLATTWYVTDYIQMLLPRLNVKHLVRKPCSLPALADRVREIACMVEPESASQIRDKRIASILLELGVYAKPKGHTYLRSGISLAVDCANPRITKDIYPALAKEFHVTVGQVERAIGRAIQKAHKNGDPEIWGRYFPRNAEGQIPCPTNGEFICALANCIRMEEGKNLNKNGKD